MHVQSLWGLATKARGPRPAMIAAFVASLLALLAAIPTGSAVAGPATPSITLPAQVTGLPTGEVEKVLGEVPLGTLGVPLSDLEVPQLTKLLAQLKGLSGLSNLTGLGGTKGLEQALTTAIDELVAGNGKLGELLTPATLAPKLESALSGVLGPVLGPELNTLVETLLNKSPTNAITEGLGSVNLNELLSSLLKEAEEPTQLIDRLFTALSPTKVEELLGTTLTGAPFSKTTVGELAGQLEMTTPTLDKELGTNLTNLPETATALTTPLTNGKLLGVLDGLKGVSVGLLGGGEKEKETSKEGSKEASKEGGSESNESSKEGAKEGGTSKEGGSGLGSSSGLTGGSVVVNLPAAAVAAIPASTPAASTPKAVAKVKILSHEVKGHVATLVLQIPAAGRIVVSGGSVRAIDKQASKSERLTVRIPLSKAGTASLRKHRNRLRVSLKAAFTPVSGASSTANVTVRFA
jgi:hypothetical protein